MRYLVIGAGPAGVTAAETLRKLDREGSVTLLGDEPEPPYSRMAIPYLLSHKIDEHGTYLRKIPGHFGGMGIELRQGRVRGLDPSTSRVTLQDGASLDYERVLIATGSRPVVPPIPGAELPGVHPCWTLADARNIARRAAAGADVVLIGAGFIGSIILEALVQRGCRLTVLEMGDRMVPRMMNPFAGALIRSWCERKGVVVRVSTRVTEIERSARERLRVHTGEGEPIEADLVIVAVGVRPNVELLQGSGVETRAGVLVDEHLQTNVDGIYAAGDVAEGRDFSTGDYAVHAIQPTAAEHGRIAALNMAGHTAAYRGSLNMNVLDTLGLISSSFGIWMGVEGGESAELREPDAFRYLDLQFDGDFLVGATSLGHTEHIGVLRGLIHGRVPLGRWKHQLLGNPTRIMEAYLAQTGMLG